MNEPHACERCLRRAWLLAELAPQIERTITSTSGLGIDDLLAMSSERLVAAVAPDRALRLPTGPGVRTAEHFAEHLEAVGCWATCRHDASYPERLREGPAAPWALIGRGDPLLLAGPPSGPVISIVGSRRATSYGREVARTLASELAAMGAVVVSGLAFGIDSCAHRGALDAGRTIAVLGCGADIAYPAANRSLWRRIGEEHLVVSELAPGAGPSRWSFPARNRIIAGLSEMTVVVEAAPRSGSLGAAASASRLGRVVGAVPGPVNSRASAGTNALLVDGARLVRDASDVMRAIDRG